MTITQSTTTVRSELAQKRPANMPARPAPKVIDGQVKTRRDNGFTIFLLFVGGVVVFLLAGLLLSLMQQAH